MIIYETIGYDKSMTKNLKSRAKIHAVRRVKKTLSNRFLANQRKDKLDPINVQLKAS